jgi:malto-oligosyltrehalose trehalohydrolase
MPLENRMHPAPTGAEQGPSAHTAAARRAHAMPFGATVRAGSALFRLWAPGARSVALRIESAAAGEQRDLPMRRAKEGWYALQTGAAKAGTLYAFVIDGEQAVPDPASRFQPHDLHGPSEVIDPTRFEWRDGGWRGRPWHETVLYELHVGAFSPEGTYAGVAAKLDHLAALGITAIELMPLAEAPGARNWGYDGVLPFAPEQRYGRPEALKSLVDAAHARGLMVFLDVVYNHFGPEGNYLHRYAPDFFAARHQTPWGAAINFEGERGRTVRDFFVHNALYWLEEFHLDGLRLDAVHAIRDESRPDFLEALAAAVRAATPPGRHVHLVLENDDNAASRLGGARGGYTAQWSDDFHHALHVMLTGEGGSYYADYAGAPARHLARTLAEGFAYQGEPSRHRGGRRRGQPSGRLPPTAFVSFLQNHDQVGNRAFGERIGALAPPEALRAAVSVLLLSPMPPLLFMGEEWNAPHPFPFFCDFGPELADAVREGRRREFAQFPEFADPAARERIPDPLDPATFASAQLDWTKLGAPAHAEWLAYYRLLLALRHREIVPRLAGLTSGQARWQLHSGHAVDVTWRLSGGAALQAILSLAPKEVSGFAISPRGRLLFATDPEAAAARPLRAAPPWFAAWFLDAAPPP